ncbi:chorismate mutase [Candidatus Pacearchaeota archaeon]|nr:chorismate mutase [Candidatus Pacearchaeota archaeon]
MEINKLETIREEINKTDEDLIKLLDKRFEIVKTVVKIKKEKGIPFFQAKREQEILNRVSNLSKNSESSQNIFKVIMKETLKFEENL